MKKFYDTSSLLLLEDFSEPIIISSITLFELEEIKSSQRKDEEVRAAARHLLHLLDNKEIQHRVIIYNNSMLKKIEKTGIEINNDAKILATALYYERTFAPNNTVFITNDLAQKAIAELFFERKFIQSVHLKPNDYTGYLDLQFTDEELAYLYEHLDDNKYNLNINQYLIVHNPVGEVVDKLCWTGTELRPIKYYTFFSHWLGEVKPKPQDIYQALAMDSLVNNQLTMLKGPAGSGKTFLSLAYLFHLLAKHKIDKIIIFCNTVATKNSAKLGSKKDKAQVKPRELLEHPKSPLNHNAEMKKTQT